MQHFKIDFYRKIDQTCPIQIFLDSVDVKMKAKASRLLLLVEENGTELREPYSKYLEDGIFELRIKQGNNISRILYFFLSVSKIILTNGFIKKTLKTPRKDLKLAKTYRADYLERRKKHE